MLRALLIWLCFTEILKKTGSSSRSAWSPWHFSENLDQLGTWYIYIYLVSIRSIFANFLQLKSDQKSDQIESILQLWNEHDGSPHTRTHTYISEDNDAFFSKNEPCFFFMVWINTFCWSLAICTSDDHSSVSIYHPRGHGRILVQGSRGSSGMVKNSSFSAFLVVAILWVPPLGKSWKLVNVLDEYAFQD